jgi:hypothetical protein
MRINPSEKVLRGEEEKQALQLRINKVTRIVALVIAFASTFFFFIKILFL